MDYISFPREYVTIDIQALYEWRPFRTFNTKERGAYLELVLLCGPRDDLLSGQVTIVAAELMWHWDRRFAHRFFGRLIELGLVRKIKCDFTNGIAYETTKVLPGLKFIRKTVDAETRRKIFERDNYACKRCGAIDQLSIDHIHPVAHGGTNNPNNLQTLCLRCNTSKGHRVVEIAG